MLQILVILSLFSFFISAQTLANPSLKPNVILIYADDLGPGLLGFNGQKIIKTPHIDQLANQGMRFNNAFGCIYCAPARGSLLTGIHDGHQKRWQITQGGQTIKIDQGKITEEAAAQKLSKAQQAKPNEIFLAQLAQQAGYVTAQFGKLDWGFQTTHKRLKRHGWDTYLGYMDHQRAHGFYPTYLWKDGAKLPLPGNTHLDAGKTIEHYNPAMTVKRRDRTGKQTYSQNVFIKHILRFLDDHQDQPFFIYHSTQLPHGPVDIPEVHADFVNDKRLTEVEKEYASMVKMLDDHVGLIMKKLKERKLDRKTIVIFTSDNGHEIYYFQNKGVTRKRTYHGDNDVFKGTMGLAGMKWTSWQGGMRVPLIVRWPDQIKANSQSDLLVAGYDFMPTLVQFWQTQVPKGKDGISFAPTLLGKTQNKTHNYIYIANNAVITKDSWKLVQKKNKYYLFNLNNDPKEKRNLSESHPKQLKRLRVIMKREKNAPRKDV